MDTASPHHLLKKEGVMAGCGEYRAMIQLYVDDELTGSDQQELLSHLENCAGCSREMEELKKFYGQIGQARPRITAPAALRERILKLRAEGQGKKLPQRSRPQNSR